MNLQQLIKSNKLFLNVNDIANLLSITRDSAKVTASRYTDKGSLIRLKKDFYITENQFYQLDENELFRLANLIQTPSYISLTTALSYYNISTQQQRNFIESIAQKRTKSVTVRNIEFNYSLIKKDLYTGFELKDNFFIALPEKALVDAIYLSALKRYNCDFDAIDFSKIKKDKVESFLKKTNKRTKSFWKELCKTYKI